MNNGYTRWRWHEPINETRDMRPMTFPPPGPWWCSGEGDDYFVMVAYLPTGTRPDDPLLWPDAQEIEECSQHDAPEFSERFPRPRWWHK